MCLKQSNPVEIWNDVPDITLPVLVATWSWRMLCEFLAPLGFCSSRFKKNIYIRIEVELGTFI